ncbi:MAG: hypothetical protein HY000_07235 [Planctomycetes bacterium]|nr:hypothetical protein [Planctomycetota bacterium]
MLGGSKARSANRRSARSLSRRDHFTRRLRFDPLEDRRLLDATGPRVLGHTPTEVRNAAFDHIDVTFSEAIDLATFTIADVRISGKRPPPF